MATHASSGRTLNRDYKGVRRHTHVAVSHAHNGWLGFGAGLAVGLAVALGVHLHYRSQATAQAEPLPAPAQTPASEAAPDEGAIAAAPESGGESADPGRLDFYVMLPQQEVEVPESKDPAARGSKVTTPLPTGDAVLQAGSFKQATEAEKMVAQLALHGVDAKIQRASVDDETWYRVRIGPIATVEELHNVRSKLREAEVATTHVTAVDDMPLP